MSKHLLAIAVGPVQDFIGAARRTRDLWFGSELLSNVSQSVAQAVKDAGGNLIFPNDAVLMEKKQYQKVANIILGELPDGLSPIVVKETAKKAARRAWEIRATDAKNDADKAELGLIEKDVWKDQVDDVIEFYAAWKILPTDHDYSRIRSELMRLLAGRKACRNFLPAAGIAGRPKSSLDGARESIWNPKIFESGIRNKPLRRRLRLTEGEQLDVVGLTKRLGGGVKGYPSVSRIAADPWLRGFDRYPEAQNAFAELKRECESLKSRGLGVTDIGWKQFASFPYEGTAVMRNRYVGIAKETGEEITEYKTLDNIVQSLEAMSGVPQPYLAILMADGDHMGKAISALQSADQHRAFSMKLARFTGHVDGIVKKYHGCLIYSGGDDILAFIPVDTCLSCARELHDEFGKSFEELCDGNNKLLNLSLSVGIAIGHYIEPMEDLREYAREAESSAKRPDRNGLAIHLHPRSGASTKVRGQWRNGFCGHQEYWAKLHCHDLISDKAAFDLRRIAADYRGWSDREALKTAITMDIRRMLGRKIPGGADAVPQDLIQIVEDRLKATEVGQGDACTKYVAAIEGLANEWLIARRIAKAMIQANGKDMGEIVEQRGRTL